jgi:hypothetical protein
LQKQQSLYRNLPLPPQSRNKLYTPALNGDADDPVNLSGCRDREVQDEIAAQLRGGVVPILYR